VTKPPAKKPCPSCPYRCDVPSGVWADEEYEKLPVFDDPNASPAVFYCHQQTGHLCAGWVGVHDMENMIGIRLAALDGRLTPDDVEAVLDYTTDVPLFESGAAAAAHGMDQLATPDTEATRLIRKLLKTKTPIPRTL